jgi:F420-non-reducing hydrogenase small subunit
MEKLKLALYWAASCGGCEIAVVELGTRLLKVAEAADIVFWPAAMDFKYKDVEAMPDGFIDVCLFNGAIRTSENEHLAKLLRAKSKVLVAFGSCAHEGCIPGLANLKPRSSILERIFKETPSTENPEGILPQTRYRVAEGELVIPEFQERVRTLAQVVQVDYIVPGCPPAVDQVWAVLEAVIQGRLPAPQGVVGADAKTVCDQCKRVKEGRKVKHFFRPHEIVADPEICFLEQGIICAGPATRAGCGTPCINGDMPCRGCYGPPDGVIDQGAKLLSALASVVDGEDDEEIRAIIGDIVDPVGTLYRFSLADSLLQRLG